MVHKHWADPLVERLLPPLPDAAPSLSLIIPVHNGSLQMATTLESIQRQDYPHLEVIVIDASSKDHTRDVVEGFGSLVSRFYTVSEYHLGEMINRGLALAKGRYVSILIPGSFYISDAALTVFGATLVQTHEPELLFCGSIQEEGRRTPRPIFLPLDKKHLERGINPATLPACWFRKDLFDSLGEFDTNLTLRPHFDLLCRFFQGDYRFERLDRFYLHYDHGRFSYAKLLRYASETWTILFSHFGLGRAIIWLLGINYLNLFKWWLRDLDQRHFK